MLHSIFSAIPVVVFGIFASQQTQSPDAKAPLTVAGNRKRELSKPTQIHVLLDGKPLSDVMYPFLGDIDGDGKVDLLIGTRMEGRLLFYSDVRSATNQTLTAPQWFDDRVPTGRIPAG